MYKFFSPWRLRERRLFNRLAEGYIELPDNSIQLQASKASKALKELKLIRLRIKKQLSDIEPIPNKILSDIFHKLNNVSPAVVKEKESKQFLPSLRLIGCIQIVGHM